MPVPPLAAAILTRIDGVRTLAEIARAVEEGGAAPAAVARDMAALRAAMEPVNRLLISAPRAR